LELAVFDALARKVEELLGRLKSLAEENQVLSARLQEKETALARLEEECRAALTARDEAKVRVEALLERIEEALGRV